MLILISESEILLYVYILIFYHMYSTVMPTRIISHRSRSALYNKPSAVSFKAM